MVVFKPAAGLVVAMVVAIFAAVIAGALGLDFLVDLLEEFLLTRDFFVTAIGVIFFATLKTVRRPAQPSMWF